MSSDPAGELRHVMQRLFRRFGALSADSTPCGKPLPMAHAHALMVLLEQGELTQQELGKALNIDKSNVARLCAKMVDAGHASQKPNARDGRSRLVSLTASGKRLAREVDAASHARFEALLAGMPVRLRRELVSSLSQLVEAMETSLGESVESSARGEGSTP